MKTTSSKIKAFSKGFIFIIDIQRIDNLTNVSIIDSFILNLDYVSHFENEGYLILQDIIRVPISRSNKKAFLEFFNK